jgi:5-methylcytosine-specific restriction endonuclease McrA
MARFLRTHPEPITTGDYRKFRPYVRKDFERRCAYCLLQEVLAGGEENFELDHFRPKWLFAALKLDFYNIYYACHPCNNIKHDKWPSQLLEEQGKTFVDLCKDNFETHFDERPDGTWMGLTPAAEYTRRPTQRLT